jgi:hypothetical protein
LKRIPNRLLERPIEIGFEKLLRTFQVTLHLPTCSRKYASSWRTICPNRDQRELPN